MLANMASSLILHKKISTTTAKAKALRLFVEPIITKSKEDSTHSRRVVFSYLQDKYAVSELFREISPKIIDRPGGYTRILKTGTRLGDSADMCVIELVDYNENLLSSKDDTKGKSSRRRRKSSSKPKTEAIKTETATVEAVENVQEVDEISITETLEASTEDAIDDPVSETEETITIEASEVKAEDTPKTDDEEEKKEE